MSSFSISIKRVLNNFAANAFGQAMNGVYQFISVPLFLHYWNKEGYGEWLVLFSIPNLLWSLEGGLAGVASNRMTVAASTGNWELANSIFQNVLILQGIFSCLLLAGTVVAASTLNLVSYFGFRQISNSDASTIIVLLIGYMLTGFCLSLLRAAYRASVREARGVMAINLWRLAEFGLVAVVLGAHGTPVFLAKCMLLCVLVVAVIVYFDVCRTCRCVEFGMRRASWSEIKQIFIDGVPLLSGQAAAALSLQGYPLIINQTMGAAFVVTFATIRTVSRMVLLFIQVVSFSSAPEVSRSYGRKDWALYLRLLKIMFTCALCGGAITIFMLATLGPWIIQKWTAGKVVVDHFPMFLFSISIALQGMWSVGGVVLVCTNMHHLYNYLYLSVTIGGLFLANVIMPLWGFSAIPGTMVLQDALLLVIVASLFQAKMSHIRLRDLGSVFTIAFYKRHMEAARSKFDLVNSK